jgi:hypothetical protein
VASGGRAGFFADEGLVVETSARWMVDHGFLAHQPTYSEIVKD